MLHIIKYAHRPWHMADSSWSYLSDLILHIRPHTWGRSGFFGALTSFPDSAIVIECPVTQHCTSSSTLRIITHQHIDWALITYANSAASVIIYVKSNKFVLLQSKHTRTGDMPRLKFLIQIILGDAWVSLYSLDSFISFAASN